MDQSFDINLYDYPAKDTHLNLPSSPNKVQGWLMGVQGYRDSSPSIQNKEPQPQRQGNIINSNNNNNIMIARNVYGTGNLERRKSISSIASEDSVNLDDLIKANYTLDVDDETDLPNLASLDLDDDSKEDFWKMDKDLSDYQALINQKPKQDYRNTSHTHTLKDMDFASTMDKVEEEEEEYKIYTENSSLDSPELSWSPPDDHLETLSPLIDNAANSGTRHRSGSINSDNSLNSYSTVTVQQYSRYGMTPMIYQSDSTSTSSRTPSRLSNYSTSSQTSSNTQTTTLPPRPRKVSATSTGMPSPSRSISNRDEAAHLLPRAHSRLGTSHLPSSTGNGSPPSAAASNGRSKLAKRASHIPSPSFNNAPKSPTNISGPSRLTAIPSTSKSTGVPGSSRPVSRFGERPNGSSRSGATSMTTAAGSTTSRKLASRASHIPSAYERSTSPISGGRGGGIRNSVFGLRRDDDTHQQQQQQPSRRATTATPMSHLRSPENQRRNASPIGGGKPMTGMRPPADTTIRSSSRIGLRKL